MSNLRDQWLLFHATVMPTATLIQTLEARRTFYAGAYAVLSMIVEGNGTQEDSTKLLVGLYTEIEMFAEEVKRGQA